MIYVKIKKKRGKTMIDSSKKGKKATRIIAGVISILLVVGMIIGLLVTVF